MIARPVLYSLFFVLCSFTLAACTTATPTSDNPLTAEPMQPDEQVAVVEFSDFNCPACKSAYPLAHQVAQIEGVHFELRHYPLPIPGHETSRAAANAYECGKQQGLGDEFAQALFDQQSQAGFSEELLLSLPQKYGFNTRAGFDLATYEQCVTDEEQMDVVLRDLAAAESAGLNATPTFLVDGVNVPARDLEATVRARLEAAPGDTPAAE